MVSPCPRGLGGCPPSGRGTSSEWSADIPRVVEGHPLSGRRISPEWSADIPRVVGGHPLSGRRTSPECSEDIPRVVAGCPPSDRMTSGECPANARSVVSLHTPFANDPPKLTDMEVLCAAAERQSGISAHCSAPGAGPRPGSRSLARWGVEWICSRAARVCHSVHECEFVQVQQHAAEVREAGVNLRASVRCVSSTTRAGVADA